jgi:hypothetical protein
MPEDFEQIAEDLWRALAMAHEVIAGALENGGLNAQAVENYFWWVREAMDNLGMGAEPLADLFAHQLHEALACESCTGKKTDSGSGPVQ